MSSADSADNAKNLEKPPKPPASRRDRWLGDLSGSVGDLGTLLPLAFALVAVNGYPPARLLLPWGLVYLATGWYYRVPVSVQPLKAMAVIALAHGLSTEQLASTGFFFGLLMLLLAVTRTIRWLERWFTPALVQGIQLGVGLILAVKAVELVRDHGLFLTGGEASSALRFGATAAVLVVLLAGPQVVKRQVVLPVIVLGMLGGWLGGARLADAPAGAMLSWTTPAWRQLPDLLVLLMIPQLPLTLGNAVFAANDACHQFYPESSGRVTATRLAASIGAANVGIGLAGGFPICHGSGGIAAHARLGARTGAATMLLGAGLVLVALLGATRLLVAIPIPVLSALLLLNAWALIRLIARLRTRAEWAVALVTGVISAATRNLALALVIGFALERLLMLATTRKENP